MGDVTVGGRWWRWWCRIRWSHLYAARFPLEGVTFWDCAAIGGDGGSSANHTPYEVGARFVAGYSGAGGSSSISSGGD